jgi:hypothetical protein
MFVAWCFTQQCYFNYIYQWQGSGWIKVKPNLSDGTNCKEADGSRLKPKMSEGTNCKEVDGLRSELSLSDCRDAETFNAEKNSHQNTSASGMSTNKNHNTHIMDSVGKKEL